MKILTSKFDVLLSMDVDSRSIHLAILDKERLIQKRTLPYDPANVLNYVRKQIPGEKGLFIYEAGPTGYGLYDYLIEHGQECAVAVPSMIPKAPGQRVKTNRVDAYRLGVQARTGDLKAVVVPEKKYRDLRHLTRLRFDYSRKIVGLKNAIRGLHLFEGLPFPTGCWSNRLIAKLQQTQSRESVEFKNKQLLCDLDYFRKKQRETRLQIQQFCRADEEIRRCIDYLMSLPGVGWIVSSYILAALGGYKHLKNVQETAGFLGLGPRENSTGIKVRRGEITAVGDPIARKMVIQACWRACSVDSDLRTEFEKIYKRHSPTVAKQKAIVATARKMVCRMHAVLRDQRFYQKRLANVV